MAMLLLIIIMVINMKVIGLMTNFMDMALIGGKMETITNAFGKITNVMY